MTLSQQQQTRSQRTEEGEQTPVFAECAQQWFDEMRIQWRNTQIKMVENTLQKYLLPTFTRPDTGVPSCPGISLSRPVIG